MLKWTPNAGQPLQSWQGYARKIHLPRLVLAATRGGVLMRVVDESQEVTDEDKSEKQSL